MCCRCCRCCICYWYWWRFDFHVFFFFLSFCSIFLSNGFNRVPSFFVQLVFKNGTASNIELVTLHENGLMLSIEIDCEFLGSVLGERRNIAPEFFDGIRLLELIGKRSQFRLQRVHILHFSVSRLFQFFEVCHLFLDKLLVSIVDFLLLGQQLLL